MEDKGSLYLKGKKPPVDSSGKQTGIKRKQENPSRKRERISGEFVKGKKIQRKKTDNEEFDPGSG